MCNYVDWICFFFFFRKDLQDDLWVKLFVSRAWVMSSCDWCHKACVIIGCTCVLFWRDSKVRIKD